MAQTIHVRGEGGSIIPMDLPLPDAIAQRMAKGYLQRVNADGTPYTGLHEAAPTTPAGTPAGDGGSALTRGETPRPAKAAPKPQWVAWAVAVHGLDPEEADGMTRADLMDLPPAPVKPAAGPGGLPAPDAPKSAWVEVVVGRGLLSREDAEAFTREDLIDLVR